MVKKYQQITLRLDPDLAEQFQAFRAHLQEEIGMRVSDNQTGLVLLNRALGDQTGAQRRKFKQASKPKPGVRKIDPDGPILAQARAAMR
jgi:hypothetical protein